MSPAFDCHAAVRLLKMTEEVRPWSRAALVRYAMRQRCATMTQPKATYRYVAFGWRATTYASSLLPVWLGTQRVKPRYPYVDRLAAGRYDYSTVTDFARLRG
jgi:hypothetical protein